MMAAAANSNPPNTPQHYTTQPTSHGNHQAKMEARQKDPSPNPTKLSLVLNVP